MVSNLLRVCCAMVLVTAVQAASAQPANQGTALVLSGGNQYSVAMTPDGAGGAFFAWADARNGAEDIYAHHVIASGGTDPSWPRGGVPVCKSINAQDIPSIASDGAGGAFIVWRDFRSGTEYDIYAHHIHASGVLDPTWPTDGAVLCSAPRNQDQPLALADGFGGLLVVWEDSRSGTSLDVYAHRILATGMPAAGWPSDGVAVCDDAATQYSPSAIVDGSGGLIVEWQDTRNGGTFDAQDAYVQRVLGNGSIGPGWSHNGQPLITAPGSQSEIRLASDGQAGAVAVWSDARPGAQGVYAQRILSDGSIASGWPADGLPVAADPVVDEGGGCIASDGVGGVIIAWHDYRSANNDIYAQRLNGDGTVSTGWPAGGVNLCRAYGNQTSPVIVTDGAGGAFIGWHDERSYAFPLNSGTDLYVQHVLSDGTLDARWGGLAAQALCTATSTQANPVAASDGTGGSIWAWWDGRHSATAWDLYAQHLGVDGSYLMPDSDAPRLNKPRDVPGDQGGHVSLTWSCELDLRGLREVTGYRVWRRVAAETASEVSDPPGALGPTSRPAYDSRMTRSDVGGGITYWEAIATLPTEQILHYGFTASTTQDSTVEGNPFTAFFVTALTGDPFVFYQSNVDSGYSVDNLPPRTPVGFAGSHDDGITRLHWWPNEEADFASYLLYRGPSPDFVPDVTNALRSTLDTGYVDAADRVYYYKLAAMDIHGNVSAYAMTRPTGTAGVGEGGESSFALWGAIPNPARGRPLMVEFTLPSDAPAALRLFDFGGRLLLTEPVGLLGPGRHSIDLGQRVRLAQGLYVLVLQRGDRKLVRRIVVTD